MVGGCLGGGVNVDRGGGYVERIDKVRRGRRKGEKRWQMRRF